MSIWAVTIAVTMNITVWCKPLEMEWFAYILPNFPYVRMFYNMALDCAYSTCYTDIANIDDETYRCLIAIYVGAACYLAIAIYLNEVVPQPYGVPKHPLFCLRRFLPAKVYGSNDHEDEDSHGEQELLLKSEDDDSK